MLWDVPTTIGRCLLVVVVAGEGLIRSGGHGGLELKSECDYIIGAPFVSSFVISS